MTQNTIDDNKFDIISIVRHRLKTDGKGVTTLVGLSGCPLKCKYCLNKKILKLGKVKQYTPKELLKIVMQDYCYFVATGGGITFGGGEPLLQYKVLQEFGTLLPRNISLNIETSLNTDSTALLTLIDRVDNWIIDIKDLNNEIYEEYTKVSNSKLLSNLEIIREREMQYKCRIRVPLIKSYNTNKNKEYSIEILKSLGFTDIDSFEYVIDTYN